LPLYAFDGGAAYPCCGGDDCARLWHPLEAPAIGNAVGNFSVIARDDGMTQWMYRGKPLYTFAADRGPGDVKGSGADSRFRVALVTRYFMPTAATIRRTLELGDILATRSGATLYQRDRVTMEELHQFRTDHGAPALGRWFGTATCDENCTKDWPPFGAPSDALPGGYWDIATRAGGARQWVYKGFALYTHAADKPGDTGGNGIYDLQQIDGAETSVDPNGSIRAAAPGAGVGAMFWHAVVP
jgi:predicted lipoprotein with Yx(FWY)xxD motif